MTSDKLIMVASVARRLGCSSRHIYNLIRDGKLQAVRIGARGLRVTEASYLAFVATSKVTPESYDV